MKKLLIFLIFSLNASTCMSDEGTTKPTIEPQARSRAPHAIPSEKLRGIMLNLNSALQGSKHADIEKNLIEKAQMPVLIKTVEDLLLTAEAMAKEPPDTKLEKYKQIGFRSLANNLYAETQNFKNVLDGDEFELIDPAYIRLNETCNGCHDTFR